MNTRWRKRLFLNCLVAFQGLIAFAAAGDWPAYQADARRSGVTVETPAFPLTPRWQWRSPAPPRPAWPQPGKELHRLDFDYAFQPVIAKGKVLFGSSADNTLRCLDLDSGRLLWRVVTDAPSRFAPAVAGGNVYLAGDDGIVRCLHLADGSPIWRFRAAPNDALLLGNGRMISRWPLRTGVLVLGGVVYVTAGVWPAQGIHVYALAADSGAVLWHNDSSGSVYMRFPHPVASGFGGVAPQGYLLASGDRLLVPTGRNIPAVFDRRTGELLFYKSAEALRDGGTRCTVWRDCIFTPTNRFANISDAHVGEAMPSGSDGTAVYSLRTGENMLRLTGKYRVLADGDRLFTFGTGAIECWDVSGWDPLHGKPPDRRLWRRGLHTRVYAAIRAGDALIVGGINQVIALEARTGKSLGQTTVEGEARGLAAADHHLLVATDRGAIVCCSPPRRVPAASLEDRPVDPGTLAPKDVRRARSLLSLSEVREGYALVLGKRAAAVAWGLARNSKLHVITLLPTRSVLRQWRTRWLGTGLYGTRITAFAADSTALTSFPPYFADLVVLGGDGVGVNSAQVCRALHPCGGVLVCLDMSPAAVSRFAESTNLTELSVVPEKRLVLRGKLPGSDDWRYPWGDPGRSGVNDEGRVRLPLDVLWFGGPGPDRMMDRHLAGPPPLAVAGRVFVAGENHVIAFDAYTGRELWSRRVPGAGRRYVRFYGSNFLADADSLYLAVRGECLRFDQRTGRVRETYSVPEQLLDAPNAPDVEVLAKKTPWHFTEFSWRFLLSSPAGDGAPTPGGFIRAGLDKSILPPALAATAPNLVWSARAVLGGKEIPVVAMPRPDGGLQVSVDAASLASVPGLICLYLKSAKPRDAAAPGTADPATATDGPAARLPGNGRDMTHKPNEAPRPDAAAMLDGLVAAFDFESGNDRVRDLSGQGFDGRATGASRVPGHTGKGMRFDGKAARVLVPPRKAFNTTHGLTAMAWVRLDRADTGTILYKAYQYGLFVTNKDGKPHYSSTTRTGDFVNATDPSPVRLGVWTHVALTHDGETQCLYVNGRRVADAGQGELVTSGNYLCLGASSYDGRKVYSHLSCVLDDVRVYARAMTAGEIRGNVSRPVPHVTTLRATWLQHCNRPPRPLRDWHQRGWGYLSVSGDLVLGSYTARTGDSTMQWAAPAESGVLFALNKAGGALRWLYRPAHGVANTEVAHTDRRLFLIDATPKIAAGAARRRGKTVFVSQTLVALRLEDGKELWQRRNLPVPGARTFAPEAAPNFLFISHRTQLQAAHGVVVYDGIAAYSAADGKELWRRKIRFKKLAAIHGDRLIVPPYSYDLHTGKPIIETDVVTGRHGSRRFIKAYGCGAMIGCRNLMLFRSGSFGFLDLVTGGTTTFAGGKPSCNVSMIPANGLVIMAEGSSGCSCSYNYQTSLALAAVARSRDLWFTFPGLSPWGPVRQLRLNFGAPGDRRDAAGQVWLGFPRPQLGGIQPVSLGMRMENAAYFYDLDSAAPRMGTPPWLYHCGLRGTGVLTVHLTNRYGVPLSRTDTQPRLDGRLAEVPWKRAEVSLLQDTGRLALAAFTRVQFLRDTDHLYIGYRRRFPHGTRRAVDAAEAFQVFLTDNRRKRAVRLAVQADASAFEEGGPYQSKRLLDRSWHGEWRHAVSRGKNEWGIEIAVPLVTLKALGLDTSKLYVNAMARMLTSHGQREIYLADPIFQFGKCCSFLPLLAPEAPLDERNFTVRLHSAAAADGAGDFAVTVQGRSVPRNPLSRNRQAGVDIREVSGVRARDSITVGLQSPGGGPQPVLNAIEILEEP